MDENTLLLPQYQGSDKQTTGSERRGRPCLWIAGALAATLLTLLLCTQLDRPAVHQLSSPAVGRFLHITDLHIDPHYTEGSTVYSQCHRKPPTNADDGHHSTGRFGIAGAKCDSPVPLINATFEYLSGWADQLDFVLWTGDSGRHDNDAEIPRTLDEIIEQNRMAASKMAAVFKVPVVPNIGNNDISPHNELPAPGHKRAREAYKRLAGAWGSLVPRDQLATFLHGGYFARDIVNFEGGGGLTALSLNTMYWYQANAKVGGCKARDSPGLEQLAWIRYQINRAKQRNRALVLIGHVAPTLSNYRPTCYHGYSRTVTQANSDRTVDVHAQLFGHSNVDVWAFVGQELEWDTEGSSGDRRLWWEREVDEESGRFGELIRTLWSAANETSLVAQREGRMWEDMEDDPVLPQALPSDFVETLLKEFEQVVNEPKKNAHLGVTTLSPSIIPKYVPAFRIFYYKKEEQTASSWARLPLGTLLDYDVYWADLPKLNKHSARGFFFQRLYRFSQVYQINDLSLDSYLEWAKKLLGSKKLRRRFRSLTCLDT
ncbi:Endopolyphosphatase [Coemansia spiralis]|uniref:Endopolyphosphatase n=2 Tax=Coemansia TaxID=4863 RepID=A0A9W8FYJ6_9FUNG|nr:Metallo-dependent phosphatase-like protein [Coemansia spiralis]KAJ1995304.1 Endopolyphosphatase [Coemansia umbellata]KAJ2619487.1 Endopolyphosphatase [Coemansia sp. RSA 1358]KAJ2671482.1 Endopolyphosphatase [Coemansia spiralis]